MATRTTKTSTKTTSTRTTKPKVAPKTSVTKAATTTAAAPVVVETPQPVVSGPMMRKKELVDAVVAKSGMKKKDVKPVVEAMLSVLGSALQDGRELNLQPLGKVKINREKKLPTGKMMIAKIRQSEDLPPLESQPDAKDMDGVDAVADTTAAAAE
ncbi:HU family DNA-binding protein [uncultured Tateyamaria sp.]|uniref:HU family DNA-binding protein n=1 Tax=uncultured Tateyamaria sp. TaxID=455651 RepID=UPI0026138262|nr:HU family DNA-binding protein [uncultured Tateyamaria sp.]